MTRRKSYLRYRKDVGVEARCHECLTYWPLTAEFWDMKSFVRCRACWNAYRRARQREWYRSDEGVRQRLRAYQEKYRKDARHAKRLAALDYYWSNADRERAKARAYYWEHRERVLEQKRAKYQRDRDAILARRKVEYHARKAA